MYRSTVRPRIQRAAARKRRRRESNVYPKRASGSATTSRSSRLCVESHFRQQPFDPPQSIVTFNGEMEGLTIQLLMLGVQESDDRSWFAEVAPRASKYIALPPRLVRREPCDIAGLAKGLGSTTPPIGRGMVDGRCPIQVTDPGGEPLAPSAARVNRICSAHSRAN